MGNISTKLTSAFLLTTGIFFFAGCGNTIPQIPEATGGGDHFVYHGHDFGPERDADYKAGVEDGCRTSDGDYTKDHTRFRTDESYHAGWEHGRLHCKGAPAS